MKPSKKVQAIDPMAMLKANSELTIAVLLGLAGSSPEWQEILSRIHTDDVFVGEVAAKLARATVDMAGRIAAGLDPIPLDDEIAKIVRLHRDTSGHEN